MANNVALFSKIESAIKLVKQPSLAKNAATLFNALGYTSEKTFTLTPNNGAGFVSAFQTPVNRFNQQKGLLADWLTVDLLFQLGDDDIKQATGNRNFKPGKVENAEINSYLFFSIALKQGSYTRSQLAGITREVNKMFASPVLILFQYGTKFSIAIITRRINKRDSSRDVLEKVTLIQDIDTNTPHRAHLEILADLSVSMLYPQEKFSNFVELQKAWEKVLDTSALNKKFYAELSNWYFWALGKVTFPEGEGKDSPETRNATSVIRLITRLMFTWFLKQKGLVPQQLFDQRELTNLLNYADPNGSTYYKAILQNLFFATLNKPMNSPEDPDSRKFRSRNTRPSGRDGNRLVTNLYRYESYFKDTVRALALFGQVPFLNGGLFDCLDKEIGAENQVIRIDGFSDETKNPLRVPDELFFGSEEDVDLNGIFDTKNKSYKTCGLINILNSYKFTVEENTPINEEIALDPELLGKVFENLLASYNPETLSTARKQTGSFYTPREIVNYMVDESLLAYFQNFLGPGSEVRLRGLLEYEDSEIQFSEAEKERLIDAIENLKVLDPACGSGAFPMGVLHKLVHILNRLDPGNERWMKKQIEAVSDLSDSTLRERTLREIEQAFANNELDYGRKLYLIEKCIYGVDIQPIAVQISKLRFFISLVVDQKVRPAASNLGVVALPNLETKFVAANSLIGIQKPKQANLFSYDERISNLEEDLRHIRDSHFSAKTPESKRKYRLKDSEKREELSILLDKKDYPPQVTKMLASWDPYEQNLSAKFFDPEWMFGIKDGFDLVIGNPPYVDYRQVDSETITSIKIYLAYLGVQKPNLYVFFIEAGYNYLKNGGTLSYINPNQFLVSESGFGIRKLLFEMTRVIFIVDVSKIKVFDASTYPVVWQFQKLTQEDNKKYEMVNVSICDNISQLGKDKFKVIFSKDNNPRLQLSINPDEGLFSKIEGSHKKLIDLGKILCGTSEPGFGKLIISPEKYQQLLAIDKAKYKKVIQSGDIERYRINPTLPYIPTRIYSENKVSAFNQTKIMVSRMAKHVRAAIDYNNNYVGKANLITRLKINPNYVLAIINSKIINYWFTSKFESTHLAGGYLRYDIPYIGQIPIPDADKETIQKLGDLVEKIGITVAENKTAERLLYEEEIDAILYQLFNLTSTDKALIEGKIIPPTS